LPSNSSKNSLSENPEELSRSLPPGDPAVRRLPPGELPTSGRTPGEGIDFIV